MAFFDTEDRVRIKRVKAEQAVKFAESLVRGEPNRAKIAWENMVEDRVRELV